MTPTKDELQSRLERIGQQHLLAFWDELDTAGQQRLQQQISELNLELLQQEIKRAGEASSEPQEEQDLLGSRAEAPRAFRLNDQDPRWSAEEACRQGEQALRSGKIGMIFVAGGQGTRLGFDQPKGMFALGPVSNRTLFQILLERLIAIGNRYGKTIPLYLMTSPATHDATRDYLEQNQRFGLEESDVQLFCQGTMPAIDEDGKILLAAKDEIALAPDGHGGMLAAMAASGCLDDAESRGIEHLFYGQIDNPLIQMCDVKLIGYHLLSQSDVTTQVVAKAGPLERVGNAISVDGRLQIIEYSDLSDDAAHRLNPDGSLTFWAGSIGVHVFALQFLRRMLGEPDAIPFHLAKKKVPFVGSDGQVCDPSVPNATKFERFIFDLLPRAQNAVVVEADRAVAFAPVKNPNGAQADTPEIAQQMMVRQFRDWLAQAGANVADDAVVEISPFFALDAGELATKLAPGTVVAEDTYFQCNSSFRRSLHEQ